MGKGVQDYWTASPDTAEQEDSAAFSASSNSVPEILRSSAQSSGERPSRIRRTKQSRDREGKPKRRRSSAGSNWTPSLASGEFARRRSVDLRDSIRRVRCDPSSHAAIPSSTAASAAVVSHPRSKAAQNAVLTAPRIVSVSMTKPLALPLTGGGKI